MSRIDILLSTYNGEDYLTEQIESIINQTYNNWRLIIRDDGSTDNTINIINAYKKRYSDKILFISDDRNLGSAKSFLTLLRYAKSPYVMFCDQDDVWVNNKIEVSLERIKKNELDFNGPVLVHTDLRIVDKNLDLINESFIKSMKLDPYKTQINYLLVQNNVTGCTMIINQKLYTLINNFNIEEYEIVMHDWFIALFCSTVGKIDFINQQLILYRQHSKNVVGAKKINIYYYFKMFLQKIKNKESFGINNNLLIQSENVRKLLLDLNIENKVIKAFTFLNKQNNIEKIFTIIKYRLFKQSSLASVLFLLNVMIEKKKF